MIVTIITRGRGGFANRHVMRKTFVEFYRHEVYGRPLLTIYRPISLTFFLLSTMEKIIDRQRVLLLIQNIISQTEWLKMG